MRRLLALLLVVGALCACSKGSNGYGAGTEAAFMETCAVHEQQTQDICGCIYEKITQQIPYDRYVELDKQMQKDEKFVPDELVSIAADCATQLTTTTTESTTTTTVPSSSSAPSSSSPFSSGPSSASSSSSSSSASSSSSTIGF